MAEIIGTAGNDVIHGTGNDDTIYGEGGDDTINGGNGDDYILGGTGNDILIGGAGFDWLDGGDGDDTITYADDETAIGGAGYDQLRMDLSNRTGPTSYDLWEVFLGGTIWSGTQTISGFEYLRSYIGSAFDDLLNISVGQTSAAQIDTGAGNDTVYSGDGNDTIDLGIGNDVAVGGAGDDTIHGGSGNDTIGGGLGADHLFGDGGDDTFGIDETDVGLGESIDGGDGFDILFVSTTGLGFSLGSVAISAIEGLVVDSSALPLAVTLAELGQFTRAEGNLRLVGAGAINLGGIVFGGIAGRDTLIELDQAISSFTFNSAAGSSVGVYAGNGGVIITGGLGNDGLVGGAGADTLSGGEGNDGLNGGTGDHLDGGAGNDWLFVAGETGIGTVVEGGTGYDILSIIPDSAAFSLDQLSISGVEELNASGLSTSATSLGQFARIFGYFTITGNGSGVLPAINVVDGTQFTLASVVTAFNLSGATYSNTGSILDLTVNVVGNSGDNIITGLAGANQIEGMGGNDTLVGGSLYDALYGGEGNDVLSGNSGNDQLFGDAGRDELYGGDGDDGLYFGGLPGDVVAGEVYDGGGGFDTLSMWGSATPPGGVFDLSGATVSGIEHISVSSVWATRVTSTQLQSFQMLSGLLVLADSGSVVLAGRTLYGANIQLNNAGQTFDATGASVLQSATVQGGSGADTITAGDYVLKVYGGDGNDVLTGAANGGQLYGEGGNDRLVLRSGGVAWGGDGYDTLAVSGSVWLNSGSGALTGIEAIEVSGGSLRLTGYQFAHGLAADAAISGNGSILVELDSEVVNGFLTSTNLITTQMSVASAISFVIAGTGGSDVIKVALTAAITADGGGGSDQIRGSSLADTILGGDGNDKLMGLSGADNLTGGTGADQFRYLFAADSTLAAEDRILDFTNGSDKLDFRALDADPVAPGRQTLSFIGTSAFAVNGTAQLRYVDSGADTLVQIDLDGNGVADMQITLVGHAGQAMAGTDFLF